jgi:hypothetical protein
MFSRTKEERIQERAYALWEKDSALEGCADEYWRQARELVEERMRREENARPGGDAWGAVERKFLKAESGARAFNDRVHSAIWAGRSSPSAGAWLPWGRRFGQTASEPAGRIARARC